MLAQMGVTQWRLREPVGGVSSADLDVTKMTELAAIDQMASLEVAESSKTGEALIENPTQTFNGVQTRLLLGKENTPLAGKQWLIISEVLAELSAEENLINNIARALDTTPKTIEVCNEAVLFQQALESTPASMILLCGEHLAKLALPSKQSVPLYQVIPQQLGTRIAPVLAIPTMAQLTKSPLLKRDVWAALQEAMSLSQG